MSAAIQESNKYDALKLENQLCFPLYACSREITKTYKPYLDKIDLTYTQYITMMVLWEHREINVKDLGTLLHLDSGTLTPLLKKLEAKGFVTRTRNEKDERVVDISLTPAGLELREQALSVPQNMQACVKLSPEEAYQLWGLLHKLMSGMEEE